MKLNLLKVFYRILLQKLQHKIFIFSVNNNFTLEYEFLPMICFSNQKDNTSNENLFLKYEVISIIFWKLLINFINIEFFVTHFMVNMLNHLTQ